MKRKLSIILLAFLATVGFYGAIAAQHDDDEGHTDKHSHGPPRRNIRIININGHQDSRKHSLNWF